MSLKTYVVLIWCSLAAPLMAQSEIAQGRLVVIGEGQASAAPDKAVITMGARHFGKTASEAMAKTSKSTAAILSRLQKAGIDPKDIQTSSLSLNPIWKDRKYSASPEEEQGPDGFEASNRLRATLRDLDMLGALLDEVTRDGANVFSGFALGLQNPEPIKDIARKNAVADARRKAELYAEAAGVGLGQVIMISEDQNTGGGYPPPMMEMAASRSAPVPIAQGEISMSASIKIIFALQ